MKVPVFGARLVDAGESLWRRLQARRAWPWVALFAFLWLAATTWTYPLLLPDEGRYVGVAWQMLASGDFLTPRLDGLPFFHKPPLFYWLTAASLALFGDNAWAGRLCSVLAATALVTVFYVFLRRYASGGAARRTALILAVQPFLFGAAHYANLDMLVAALMSLTVMAGADAVFRREQLRPDAAALAAMYVAAAAGFLAKGLIGVVLPGGVLFFWLLGRRRWRAMGRLLWWPGILLFLALTLPWMVAMELRHPGFFDYYIVHQHFQRFLESGFNNPHPFWFYVPVVLGLTLPWSIQLWRWFQPRGPMQTAFVPPAHRIEQVDRGVLRGLMLSWLAVVLVFFSIPTSKLVGYVIAVLPPLAWFIQETFEQREESTAPGARASLVRHALVAAGLCLLAVAALVLFPQRSTKDLALALAAGAAPGDRLVMLDQYAYDVPMYAGWRGPVVAVAQWDDPKVMRGDDWRRELADAAGFAPDRGADRLWLPQRLQAYLCDPAHATTWLLAWLDEADRHPPLADRAPVARTRKMGLWRVPAAETVNGCGETPSSAPE
ncbi:Polymyxin resistance protein ArnT, undecaprenyl phosphate-alpha-L-Ara4N transferase; Melittin resistance protein PqaB [Castellaniella defragrans 65Phen]|uniref:Polymyxin resistance protein ArnT, undecaprenyl phosphate-alpha-L-Ara4N transferase Melittin resistance protein PqaB n=1 Tax=Castellaniella defragrans (strain DSM 12143 / CCUG 39792 / 65Phen) TaxID=1437824 RepID=W8X0I4_CASD6|nr:glycosyltransferase family 39 protein [Castellaniella defragrans]CDM25583.1 Polymyxin resistance protein ArnT, undecaprenyl phosphate-alpha-L-Ara4N transferase; Melittin resistance protein PqaB [Castellaniella defragrans 65Phen]